MENIVAKDVFLIINSSHLNIIKEIKEKLLEYDIKLNIYKKDDDIKRLFITDTIVILDNELILDYGYLKQIETLVKMKRAAHIFKLDEVDLTDVKLFFSIDDNEINNYLLNNEDFLLKLVMSLKTFKRNYHVNYAMLDRKYSKDLKFIRMLDFILKNKISNKEELKNIVALSSKEFEEYYKIVEKLLIMKMTDSEIKELLPFTYQQVYKKMRVEIKLSAAINELYYQKEYLQTVFNNITVEDLQSQYDEYLDAVKSRNIVDNTFVKILEKLEVIRIVDGEIRNVLKDKDILAIKCFIESKYIKNEKLITNTITDTLFINYVDDIRIRSIKDFHKINKFNITENMDESDIVVTLVTKKSLYDQVFIDNIRKAFELNKKVLFVYVDKCSFNLSIQYLIGMSDIICFWAYKRIDKFFIRYYEVILDILKNEPKKVYSNIVRLK